MSQAERFSDKKFFDHVNSPIGPGDYQIYQDSFNYEKLAQQKKRNLNNSIKNMYYKYPSRTPLNSTAMSFATCLKPKDINAGSPSHYRRKSLNTSLGTCGKTYDLNKTSETLNNSNIGEVYMAKGIFGGDKLKNETLKSLENKIMGFDLDILLDKIKFDQI